MSSIDAFVRGRASERPTARRRWLGPALAGLVLVAVGLVALAPPETGSPYDPTSVGPTGLRALVDVLRELGVEVEVTDDLEVATTADAVLVPPVGWTDEEVLSLAASGARVVAEITPDPEAIAEPIGVGGVGLVDLAPECDLLMDVTNLRSSLWPGHQLPPGVEAVDRCVVRGDVAWLHLMAVGEGELVSVATMAPFVNQRFVDSDAALAAVRLLAPRGTGSVVVLTEPPGTPPPTLFDLIDRRWFDAAWLTLGVLLVLALARGRRLGTPVDEQLPVRVPSGELARAIGDLRHRAGHDARSAGALRDAVLSEARRRLGLEQDAPGAAVVAHLAERGTQLPAAVVRAVEGPLPDDPEGLLAAARAFAELRAALTAPTDRSDHRPVPTEPR